MAERRYSPEATRLIRAMRADHLSAPQSAGLWNIDRIEPDSPKLRAYFSAVGRFEQAGLPPSMTVLRHWTDATMHLQYGETVMSDDPRELARHLPIVLAAFGRVLVSGLGLGCVVRGLLARTEVEHVEVLEKDANIIAMVGPSFIGPRVTITRADALTWEVPTDRFYDFSWHDVWTPGNEGLDVLHAELLVKFKRHCWRQGAWQFPRMFRNRWPDKLLTGNAAQSGRTS